MITIYNFPRGARGHGVMWLCEEMGVAYKAEPVSFPPSAEYRARFSLGSVPFLEDEPGVAMSESIAMLLYVAEKYGPTPLLPRKEDPSFARVLQMAIFGEASIGAPLGMLLAAKFAAPEGDKRNWSVRSQESRVEKAVRYAADTLGAGSFIAGDAFTVADISVSAGLVMWSAALGHALPESLVAYQARMKERPAHQRATRANT